MQLKQLNSDKEAGWVDGRWPPEANVRPDVPEEVETVT